MGAQVKAYSEKEFYKTIIRNEHLQIIADEPVAVGGGDTGFTPEELLCSSLAACTSITVRMYAKRKEWDLQHINVSVSMAKPDEKSTAVLLRDIELIGNLGTDEKQRLLAIANKCPIHKFLTGTVTIETKLL